MPERQASTPLPAAPAPEAQAHPRGALLISLTYVLLLGALWGFMYLRMVRGG